MERCKLRNRKEMQSHSLADKVSLQEGVDLERGKGKVLAFEMKGMI